MVATIVSNYPGRKPENVEKRHVLLAPIAEQNERVAARKSRRTAPDVDVDTETGEELLDPVDVVDPTEEDPAEPINPSEPTS